MSNDRENLHNCVFAKTVLMLIIILHHSMLFYGGNWFDVLICSESNIFLATFSQWLKTFSVWAFALISGYIYYFIKNEKGGYQIFWQYVRNKSMRLLLPYVAVSLLWVIPISMCFWNFSLVRIIEKFVLGESPSQLWFLLMLFDVFVIYDLLFVRMKWGGKFGIILILYIVGTILCQFIPNVFQIFTAMRYLVFFHIGCMIREKFSNIDKKEMFKYGLLFLFVNLICFVFMNIINIFANEKIVKIAYFSAETICNISGAIMAFLLLSYVAGSVRWENKYFMRMYIVSFPVYLFHQQIIYILLWNFESSLNPYIMSLINFLGSLLVAYLISELLMHSKYTKIMIGVKD